MGPVSSGSCMHWGYARSTRLALGIPERPTFLPRRDGGIPSLPEFILLFLVCVQRVALLCALAWGEINVVCRTIESAVLQGEGFVVVAFMIVLALPVSYGHRYT